MERCKVPQRRMNRSVLFHSAMSNQLWILTGTTILEMRQTEFPQREAQKVQVQEPVGGNKHRLCFAKQRCSESEPAN